MKLSIITDEFTQDLDTAIWFVKEMGLDGVELRTIDSLPLEKQSEERLLEIHDILAKENIAVCDIAGSFYKCRYEDRQSEIEKLRRLIKAAHILHSPYIRCFGFLSEDAPSLSQIVEAFEEPLKLAEENGIMLLLEADPSVTTTNHGMLKDLIEAIHHPCLGAIYDPGNDLYDPLHEIPYPDGWEQIAPYVKHIHIKDAVLDETGPHCVKFSEGQVDFDSILKTLVKADYDGYLSLECHYRKDRELSETEMKLPGGASFSDGGLEACMESAIALKEALERIES